MMAASNGVSVAIMAAKQRKAAGNKSINVAYVCATMANESVW